MADRFFRIIEHTADTGFEIKAGTKKELYENAARAFFQIMWKVDSSLDNQPRNITITGGDREELLVNLLEEFLYLYDARRLVCTKIEIEDLSNTKICARAWMHKFKAGRDQDLMGVKAVTYHQLYIGRENDVWKARIFVDI